MGDEDEKEEKKTLTSDEVPLEEVDRIKDSDTLTPLLSDPVIQRLFRIFLLLSVKETGVNILHISQKIHREEVLLLAEVSHCLAQLQDPLDPYANCVSYELLANAPESMTFKEFLAILPKLLPGSREIFAEIVAELYDYLVNQVFKKGYLCKRSCRPAVGGLACRRKWCMVLPGRILYFNSRQSKRPKDETIVFSTATIKETDPACSHPLAFALKLGEKTVHFLAETEVQKMKWISAMRLAIHRSSHCTNYHRELFLARQKQRIHGSGPPPYVKPISPPDENNPENIPTAPLPQAEVLSLQSLLRERDREMDEERSENANLRFQCQSLEEKLAAERQATRDEATVRIVAARMLDEERQTTEFLQEQFKMQSEELEYEVKRRADAEREVEQLKKQLMVNCKNMSNAKDKTESHCNGTSECTEILPNGNLESTQIIDDEHPKSILKKLSLLDAV